VLKRGMLRALVTLMMAAVGSLAAAQPASAAVVIPVGQSGHACSGYVHIDVFFYFQACAWTSWNPPNSRTWFTGHFRNTNSELARSVTVNIGFHIDGSSRGHCTNQSLTLFPGGTAATNAEYCWIERTRAAVQASIIAGGKTALSPTLQIQG
jgi:hypothetical protein